MVSHSNSGNELAEILTQGFSLRYVIGNDGRYGMFFRGEGDMERVKVYDSVKNEVVSDYYLDINKRVNLDDTRRDRRAFRRMKDLEKSKV